MGGNGGGGGCRILSTLMTLALLATGGYLIWHFVGRPGKDDISNAWKDFGGFGDFSGVLGYVTVGLPLCVRVCLEGLVPVGDPTC